jgi:hypothetical protein
MNYGEITITKQGKQKKITKLCDFLEYKGNNPNLANPTNHAKTKGNSNE